MPFSVDSQFVQQAETKLGRKLPPSYKVRLYRQNGGDVQAGGQTWFLYPIFDTSDKTRLKRTADDICRETRVARTQPGFPADALAIGDNGGGDLLILLAEPGSDRFADQVYWWDHETDAVEPLAEDFSDL